MSEDDSKVKLILLDKKIIMCIKLQCRDWLAKRTERYTSHECLDELLELMALNIQRKIAGDLQSTEYYTIMVDECMNVSNKEQVRIILHNILTMINVLL